MPTPRLSDGDARAAYDAWEAHGRRADLAAASLDMKPGKFDNRLSVAKTRGMHLSPGALHSVSSAQLVPGEARGGHRRVYDETGKQIDTVRWSVPQDAPTSEDTLARMAEAFANIPAAPRIEAPAEVVKGRLGLHVVADLHMGASIGEAEAGAAYSPEIAEDRLRGGFAQCHAAMPACEVCVILYNGDTTHANDDKDRTPKSGHILKVSRSHQANVFAVETVMAWQVDEALSKHGRVVVSIKKGNHDPNTPTPLIMGMRARYRDNPRVTVIDDEDPYFVIQMGRLFLCAHHGDGAAPSKRALSIPHKFRREWGVSDYHWYFSADKHHAKADTFGGLHWRQVPSVISLEQHSHGEGYADTSGMYAAWFDTETGRVSETEIRF